MQVVYLGEELGDLGYCQSTSKISSLYLYEEILSKIREIIPGKELISISMTGSSTIKATAGEYKPAVLEYDDDLKAALNPSWIFKKCLEGKDDVTPNADFVIFPKQKNLALAIYSLVAPVIVFENKDYICAGVILRGALQKYGKILFEEIIRVMKTIDYVRVVLSTDNPYEFQSNKLTSIKNEIGLEKRTDIGFVPGSKSFITTKNDQNEVVDEIELELDLDLDDKFKMTLPDYIQKIAEEYGIKFIPGFVNPNITENLFGYGSKGNNAIIVFD